MSLPTGTLVAFPETRILPIAGGVAVLSLLQADSATPVTTNKA
jgi:hypothetical protein